MWYLIPEDIEGTIKGVKVELTLVVPVGTAPDTGAWQGDHGKTPFWDVE